MAAHRYWRVQGLEAYAAGAVALSEFQLFSESTRVDTAATLTSNIAPSTGSLASLKDDDLSTGATWPSASGLVLTWDFGAAGDVDVTNILLGSTGDKLSFLVVANLQWSDDGATWADRYSTSFVGIKWPGARAKTTTTTRTVVGEVRFNKNWVDQSVDGETVYAAGSGVFHGIANGYRLQLTSASLTDIKVRFATMPSMADVDVTAIANSQGEPSIVFRGTYWGTTNNTFGYVVGIGGGNVYFGKGSNSAVDNYTLIAVIAHGLGAGVDFTLRVTMIGSAYKVYVNGVLKLMGTDTTYTGAGEIGVRAYNGTTFFNSIQVRNPEETHPLIALDTAYVRMSAAVRISTAMSIALPYGTTKTQPLGRARPDYLTGVLGLGKGRVRGFTLDYVNPLNKPYPCRVVLMREAGNLVVREQWSKADGSYDFQYIDELQSYTVVAYYLAHGKRAVITDGLTLANGKVELMA